jgi:hypothetical protein
VRADSRSSLAPAEPRTTLGLTITGVAGSSLAAVSSALAASFMGVGGTIAGALVGSLIGTVGTAVYSHSLTTAGTRLRALAPVIGRPTTGTDTASTSGPSADLTWLGTAPATAPIVDTHEVDGRPAGSAQRQLRWQPVAAVAVGVAITFAVAVGAITVLEKALGHPVSGSAGGGTTIGRALEGNQPANTPSPGTGQLSEPTTPSTTSPSTTEVPTTVPGTQGGASSPTTSPSGTGSPAPSPTSTSSGSVASSSPSQTG